MKLKRKQIDLGYIVSYLPDHHKTLSGGYKGWVYEHILVAERKLKRALKKNEEVHHLDLVRSNNSPNNLLICTTDQHHQIHAWIERGLPIRGKNRIKGGIASSRKLVVIPRCQKCDFPINEGAIYCSAKCYTVGRRKVSKRPSLKKIKRLLRTLSWVKLGKRYGVSDNAIRKWVRDYGVDPKTLR